MLKRKHLNNTSFSQWIRYLPYFVSFSSQMALMILELDASRLIGDHFGNSLYTWAAVIGIILSGNSLGSLWGGKIADRKTPSFLFACFFVLTSLSCIFTLILNRILGLWIPISGVNWPLQIFVTALILFALPSILFGALTPLTIKLALAFFPNSRSGLIVGNVFAWGALGSIVGTVLAGFFLIAILGLVQIWACILCFLMLLAALFFFLHHFEQNRPDITKNQLLDRQTQLNIGSSNNQQLNSSFDQEKAGPKLNIKRLLPKYILFQFSASAGLMGVELLGGRLIARYYGNSLYTWTSNICVILVGMTLGYFIGGRLAKRSRPEKFLPYLFWIASFLVLITIVTVNFLWSSSWLTRFPLPWQILIISIFSILFPAVALGALSPINYQLAIQNLSTSKSIVGTLNAWAVGGSLCGTLLPGFWLIAALGTIHTILALAFILGIMSWWLSRFRRMFALWVISLICLYAIIGTHTDIIPKPALSFAQTLGFRDETTGLLFARDSHYQFVKVYRKELSRTRDIRVLALDSLIHGFIDLKDPSDLQYEYEHIYQNLTGRELKDNNHPNVFFIGAGSYTFPRWMLFRWPKAHIDVAELDPVVISANRLALGLSRSTSIHTYIGDARGTIKNLPQNLKYDLFFGDAFNDLSVPWHLTTFEFIKLIKTHLKPSGAYLLNVIDNYDNGMMVGASYLTLKKAFRHVYVFCTNPLQIQNLRDTFILMASDRPLNIRSWHSGPIGEGEGVLLEPRNLKYLAMRCNGLVLTDNYAPVENLLAPVVKKRKLK